ncbi:MAG: serine/threonine protein phosphatase [Bacteroidia bacterium]|nr:serine/threonine protein phosphatase [Bacteroidia bacterium]
MRKFAISDIHGCFKTFQTLLENKIQLKPNDELYLLGDFVDRGPDSRGVLDYVMSLKDANYKVHCIKGNHEAMMVDAFDDPSEVEMWLYNGGKETMRSFDAQYTEEIPERYIEFIDSFDYFKEVDGYILVHAGLNFKGQTTDAQGEGFLWKLYNPLKDRKSMMWVRWWYEDIDWNWLKERVIVHGHTPIEKSEIQDMASLLDQDQVLDIDNGCFAKYRSGLGNLCAFELTTKELYFQENVDAPIGS